MFNAVLAERPPIRVKNCRHGLFMYNMYDQYVGRSLDLYGEFSELENAFFKQVIKPGMTVLDIGANIGVHTVTFAHHVGSEGKVIAFEPQRVVYQMLCGNVALNGLENVSTLMAGVGNHNGNITVPCLDYKNANNFGGTTLGDYSAGEVVPLVTLDSFNIQTCHFIKIDVEGMEQAVLEGAVETMKRCQPILYVENDRQKKSEALIRYLLDMGYRLHWHVPTLFNDNNFYRNTENVFGSLTSTNMIGWPNSLPNLRADEASEITYANAHKHFYPPTAV